MSEPFSCPKMTRDEYVTSSFVIDAIDVLNRKFKDSRNRMYLESIKEIVDFYDRNEEEWIQLLDLDTLEPINVWASSFGRVKNGRGNPIWLKPNNSEYVLIYKKTKGIQLHRLVWTTQNKKRIPKGYTVDHANEVSFDNRWVNIKEIKTYSEQVLESHHNGARKSDVEKRSRTILGRKVGMTKWTQYNSLSDASLKIIGNIDQNFRKLISSVCTGRRRKTHGYEFKYAEQPSKETEVWRTARYLTKNRKDKKLYGYEVSDKLRWKNRRGIITIPKHSSKKNYAIVGWGSKNEKVVFHRVLATTFSDQIKGWNRVLADVDGKEEWVVDHIDDDPSNNVLSNLQWITKQENNQKRWDALKLAAP